MYITVKAFVCQAPLPTTFHGLPVKHLVPRTLRLKYIRCYTERVIFTTSKLLKF